MVEWASEATPAFEMIRDVVSYGVKVMGKKRKLLGILLSLVILLVFTIISGSVVFAGCCVGVTGCSRAFSPSECSSLAAYDNLDRECDDIHECDIVACCHSAVNLPKSTYRIICGGIIAPGEGDVFFIKSFTTNPAAEESNANGLCSGGVNACVSLSCDGSNPPACKCGSSLTDAQNPFCCEMDGAVFPSFGACSQSPSCQMTGFFNVSGKVRGPNGVGLAGAQVKAGGKQVISGADGSFVITGLPSPSSGTVIATLNNSINSTAYSISGASVVGLELTLKVGAVAPVGAEDCAAPGDQDGDQPGWGVPAEYADFCDSDCPSSDANLKVGKTVTYSFFQIPKENEPISRCNDMLDNDCDGKSDCEDTDCAEAVSCKKTVCGDGIVSFPNSFGVYEQCDVKNATLKDDKLCPGACNAGTCMCTYAAVCGNGIVDQPVENCDGLFDAPADSWKVGTVKGDCTLEACGRPGTAKPCRCPPKQVCGNGVKEPPEDCDVGIECSGGAACNPDCTCPPAPIVCGNNLVEPGEDCDGVWEVDADLWGGEPEFGGSWVQFKTRKFGCGASTCAPPEDKWKLTPPPNSVPIVPNRAGTKFQELVLDVLGVSSGCMCPTVCKSSPPGPTMVGLSSTPFVREIKIDWTDECVPNLINYNIFRCVAQDKSGTGCSDPVAGQWTPLTADPIPVTNTFKDLAFPSDSYVCYKIVGQYDTLDSDERVKMSFSADPLVNKPFDAAVMCIKTGSDECYTLKSPPPVGHGPDASEVCALEKMNVRSTCDANNSLVPSPEPDENDLIDCNVKTTINGEDVSYLCVGPFSETGKTKCVPNSICEYCNDPFGLFGFSAFSGVEPGKQFGFAPETPGLPVYKPCRGLDFCYKDYSYTSVDKFKQLRPDKSCYDYLSEEACDEDKAQLGVCEWMWHPRYGELGVGVCRSKVVDEQKCERCHDPLNEVFGKCDRETCALYGRCYYDKDNTGYKEYNSLLPTNPRIFDMSASIGTGSDPLVNINDNFRCVPEREIACIDYDTEEDCVGSANEYSLLNSTVVRSDVLVDVNWSARKEVDFVKSDFVRNNGSNRVVNKSDDFFGFGKCQWRVAYVQNGTGNVSSANFTENVSFHPRCIKNSDLSPPIYEAWESTKPEFEIPDYDWKIVYEFYDDCPKGKSNNLFLDILDCRKDTTEPITSIIYPGRIAGNFKLPAFVDDDSVNYSSVYPATFVCVADGNMTRKCYPDGRATPGNAATGNIISETNVNASVSYNFSEKGFQTGFHTFYFYSEDISHNLEVVRNFTTYIDADPPNVVITTSNISFEAYEDEWRTNLTMRMNVVSGPPDYDAYAICSAGLFYGGNNIYVIQNIIEEYNNSWERNFSSLMDGDYIFSYSCEDSVGNVAAKNLTWTIDGDRSITNVLPRGTLNYSDVSFSVDTGTNAECRYLRSEADIPPFNETLPPGEPFPAAVFDAMAKFDSTGTPEVVKTFMHHTDITAESGLYRYYVKCKMFNDGKIRGNRGDEVRFAVDLVPPVSAHLVDRSTYNDFYNSDILVSLVCEDVPIFGFGMLWQYGCGDTYYCIGQDCDGYGDYKLYEGEIPLDKTQYISYYSVDKGNNKETPIQNILFQIDNETPDFDLRFFDGDVEASVLILDVPYKVVLNASKDLMPYSVLPTTLEFTSQPAKFIFTVDLVPTSDPRVREGLVYVKNINANKGFEGTGVFEASVSDYHNLSITKTFRMPIDTKPPNAPTLAPSLNKPSADKSEYEARGYPLHYANGVYYSRNTSLFITGFTDERLDIISVTNVEGVSQEYAFSQTNTTKLFDDVVISGFANEVRVGGDITSEVSTDDYFGFDSEQKTLGPRTVYGGFGLFYDVTSMVYVGGDEDYTSLSVYPALEVALPVNKKIYFYDKDAPTYWFGFHVPLQVFKNTTLYVKAYDWAKNLVRVPAVSDVPSRFTLFCDPVAPTVAKRFPRPGTTADTTFNVFVILKEGRHESGLDNSSVNMSINGKPVAFSFTHDEEFESLDASSYYYRVQTSLSNVDDGNYTVVVNARDFARNPVSQDPLSSSWTFTVDHKAPHEPLFTLIGGILGPLDRWYINHAPQFTLEFSDADPVTVTDIYMDSFEDVGGAAVCVNESFNRFICTFTEAKGALPGEFWADYAVLVSAFKTLADGSDSPTGFYGPFEFTVDDEAPDFTLSFNKRVRKGVDLPISADVANEKHPLYSNLTVKGEDFTLYSSTNGSGYLFIWSVPDYDKSQEGDAIMEFTLSDYAQNYNVLSVPIYIDLTPPSIANVVINISNTITIGGEKFTSHANVSISGDLVDDDVVAVWVIPGDYNETTGVVEDEKMATLIRDAAGVARSFEVMVRLQGEVGFTEVNRMVLFVKDAAGYISQRNLRVVKDLEPPKEPVFCTGAFCTVPQSGGPSP